MADTGWIRLYRKFRQDPLWPKQKKFSKSEAWLDLLMSANWQDETVRNGNQTISLERGQLLTTLKRLAKRWGWKTHRTRLYLDFLQTDEKVVLKTTNRFSIISICNYERYQNPEEAKRQRKGKQKANKRQTNGGTHYIEEFKEVKEIPPPIVPPRKKAGKRQQHENLNWLKAHFPNEYPEMVILARKSARPIRNLFGWGHKVCLRLSERKAERRHQELATGYRRDSESSEPSQAGEEIAGIFEGLKGGQDGRPTVADRNRKD